LVQEWGEGCDNQKFAAMVESRWDGMEAYCHEENRVPLGFVEGMNSTIRALQRTATGTRSISLKVLTSRTDGLAPVT
jgi:transposase